jgi:copper chaperone CopZ
MLTEVNTSIRKEDTMAYDLEKYREKREKVLGVKKRGLSFGTLAAIVSLVIIFGLGVVVVPKSIAYFNTRHLDDAIYKLQNASTWPQEIITGISGLAGVKSVETDDNNSRVVVTFDKTITGTPDINAFFKQNNIETVLLNQINHAHRQKILEKEAKF